MKTPPTGRRDISTPLLGLLLFALASAAAIFALTEEHGVDSVRYAFIRRNLFSWTKGPFDLSPLTPNDLLGGPAHPLGVWLQPACLIPHLVFDDSLIQKAGTAFVCTLLVASSTYFLARSISLSPLASTIVTQVTAFLIQAPTGTWIVQFARWCPTVLFKLADYFVFPCVLATTCLGALLRIRDRTLRENLPWIVLVAVLPSYSVLADPLYTTMGWVAPVSVMGVVLVGSSNRRIFAYRALAGTCAAMLLGALRIPSYYRGVMGYSIRNVFPNEVANQAQFLDYLTSMVFQFWGGSLVSVVLVASALASRRSEDKDRRSVAMGGLIVFAAVIIASLVYVYSGIRWRYPFPSYYEQPVFPLYMVIIAVGVERLVARWRSRSLTLPVGRVFLERLAVCGLPLIVIVNVALTERSSKSQPMHDPAVTRFLIEETAVPPGERFRGSVSLVTFVPGGRFAEAREASDDPDNTPFSGIEPQYEVIPSFFEPDLWTVGLNRNFVPTLEGYSLIATPPMHYLFTRLLRRPIDYQGKNWLLTTRPRPNLMQVLGVRYLLTDLEIRADEIKSLVFRLRHTKVPYLDLFEFKNPNIGNYAPVRVDVRSTVRETIELMRQPDYDFRERVVLFERLGDVALAPILSSTMAFERGGVHVRAESVSTSLLVLPIQYSRCLMIGEAAGPTPMLLRADLVLTGLLFTGRVDVRLSHRFSPGDDPKCRLLDIDEAKRLGFVETGEVRYPPGLQPHAIF